MEMNQQYLDMFIEESKEHLQACSDQLLELEKNPNDLSIVNEIFRSAHTLKGMAATMGFEDLADLTHKMENVLDAIRNEKIVVDSNLLDIVFESVDHLEAMIVDIANGGDGKRDVSDIVSKLKAIEAGQLIPTSTPTEQEIAADVYTEEPTTDRYLIYDEYDVTVLQQSKEQGFNVYEITVSLRPDCLLKAARVYMVFEVLEKNGEVLKSFPTVEKLEEEQFDQTFQVTFITKDSAEEIQKKINKVSEIDKVVVIPLTKEMIKEASKEELVSKEQLQQESKKSEQQPSKQQKKSEPLKKESNATKQSAQSKTIRVSIERLDILMNLFEELVIDRGRLQSIATDVKHSELTETVERMSRTMGDLQNIVLTMRMIPIETVFNRFPKMVRSLSRDLNKKINLEIIGAETELDRTVIDEIGDPLVHLIRNSVDHGIESPEVRKAKGKPEEGTVILRAYHSGNYVFIEIEDDGAGINKDKVLKKAIDRGIVTKESALVLTDKQINELIFESGFSTAEKITDVSGRGVGLDVVKTTIQSLGGSISIESEQDVGSKFSIQLPLTLSIISVMLVEIEKEIYAIPLSSIIETSIIKKSEILNAHNQKVIDFRGKVVPLIFLDEVFEVPRNEIYDDEYLSVVIVRKGDKLAGLVVDSFIGQQEIVLKSLGNYLKNIFAISGATILGNGQVALIIDINALMK
ncbi:MULTISPECIES: chemotaxis protein CheA [Ureibacillus]|jgi:two-component system, chemotaxis family, sensor kinase CheA|uniref:Chemotaxis protein CheA n=1 Tax=Ureibacillus thermosphaericus TaxID=51173 RepID=A0A840PHG1_URETH|nr:chemotaxis protein CheA [Ureibacillus thermosphaericus]MBB5147855.1 two-component system chemotaxis sensor kinase CheA [Ureibacillus thermosphaericus]NKZ30343.1 chemotaxis protein CheA [Ureibacillus thermosphaericus]